jgi:glycosyltransferase involved in cell wall biosynthesis
LDVRPDLHAWFIGDGPLRITLERAARRNSRVEFLGLLPPMQVRERLRRSRILVSGSPTEPLGIVYLEALSQGCSVVMPASGGGLEIAPEMVGRNIFLFSSSIARETIIRALQDALTAPDAAMSMDTYSPSAVAMQYLAIGTQVLSSGRGGRDDY